MGVTGRGRFRRWPRQPLARNRTTGFHFSEDAFRVLFSEQSLGADEALVSRTTVWEPVHSGDHEQ